MVKKVGACLLRVANKSQAHDRTRATAPRLVATVKGIARRNVFGALIFGLASENRSGLNGLNI